MSSTDTIYALSSGFGKAGIAVLRLSGHSAAAVVEAMTGGLPPARRAAVRVLRHATTSEILDQGVVLWLPGPGSFTGEDMAEFHVHGSAAVVRAVFEAFGAFEGVRPAEAGEFSRRAFANGRMDLVEAEGLGDLLNARSSRQRQQAVHHLLGGASTVYEGWRTALLGALARVEAAVDFIEEDGVAETAMAHVAEDVGDLARSMNAALADAERAQAVRDGIKVVLAGLPNTGKSSLLNALARRDAAIVSARPGTTRDVIEVGIEIEGMAIVLSDTAGLRDGASDDIEALGIEKSWRELEQADFIVWVSAPDIPGSDVCSGTIVPALRVLNKVDLAATDSDPFRISHGALKVSALSGAGISGLVSALGRLIIDKYGENEVPVIVRSRQKQAIAESIRYLNESLTHDPSQLELVAEDLRKAAGGLARVTGRIDVEDLLSAIFSEFCIGK